MKNDAIIDSILPLLLAYQSELAQKNPNKRDVYCLRYLIGQAIRQYDVPLRNIHVSCGALNRWQQLSSDNILNYHYRDAVKCDNIFGAVSFPLYNGSSRTGNPTTLTNGLVFIFRQMFHEDHIIPVSLIVDQMIQMAGATKQDIRDLLDSLHVCIILKEEDRRIGRTKGRSLDFGDTINNVYTPAGIELIRHNK